VLEDPLVMCLDPAAHPGLFPQWLRPQLAGVTFLCLPLLPKEEQLIGLCILYRKDGHVFSEDEIALGEMLAPSVAMSIQGAGHAAEE